MTDHPLAGTGGKPLIGVPSSNQVFVGRIIIELFENTQNAAEQSQQAEVDASSIALSINPGLGTNITKAELQVKRWLRFSSKCAGWFRALARARQQ